MVLAMLLASANHVISRDALIEGVWAGNPPPAARTSLHTYLSHLRDVLGPKTISTSHGGYVIHASPDTLDSLAFENLIEEGRRLSASDVPKAAGLLDDALSLWAGPPFGDLGDQPAIVTERERLTELRILATEYRADAYLQLGRNGQVISELAGLIKEQPYRERLYGQLMLALYRSGRQADALRVFGDVRQRLVDDLGVDPTPELWALEEQILSHDPRLLMQATRPLTELPDALASPKRRLAVTEAPPPVTPDEEAPPPRADSRRSFASRRRMLFWVILASLVVTAGVGLLAAGMRRMDQPAATTTGCLAPPAEITAWWTGDDDGIDLVGARDAKLVHGVTYGPGVVGAGFYLDGDSFVDVAHDASLDPGRKDFTVDLWARFDSTDGEQILVEKWVQTWSDDQTKGWTFTKLADNSVGFFSEGTDWALGVGSVPQDIPLDTWTHFAARRHGDTAEILINGVLIASETHPGGEDSHIGSVASLKFGHRGSIYDTSGSLDERGLYLKGAIDEVHLSVGTSLSDDHIRDLVEAGSAGYCRS
jgi:DNA-binding SARP family transcriptional activator